MVNTIDKNKLYSGFYGLAVGDALGVPVEFSSREKLDQDPVKTMREYGTYHQSKGTWSDDTSMSLATLHSISAGGVSYGMIMDAFKDWYTKGEFTPHGKMFDIGNTTREAIELFIKGMEPLECGLTDEQSNGNGSLMRMLPVVFYIYLREWEEDNSITEYARDVVYKISGLTHDHYLSKMACLYYVYIGGYILKYSDSMSLKDILTKAILDVEEYYTKNKELLSILVHTELGTLIKSVDLNRREVKNTGFVVDSLEASVWCLYNTKSYKDAVLTAINLGGDTDTIGAITGSLAGLYYGIDAIPKEWVDDLQNKELIDKILDKFYQEYK